MKRNSTFNTGVCVNRQSSVTERFSVDIEYRAPRRTTTTHLADAENEACWFDGHSRPVCRRLCLRWADNEVPSVSFNPCVVQLENVKYLDLTVRTMQSPLCVYRALGIVQGCTELILFILNMNGRHDTVTTDNTLNMVSRLTVLMIHIHDVRMRWFTCEHSSPTMEQLLDIVDVVCLRDVSKTIRSFSFEIYGMEDANESDIAAALNHRLENNRVREQRGDNRGIQISVTIPNKRPLE